MKAQRTFLLVFLVIISIALNAQPKVNRDIKGDNVYEFDVYSKNLDKAIDFDVPVTLLIPIPKGIKTSDITDVHCKTKKYEQKYDDIIDLSNKLASLKEGDLRKQKKLNNKISKKEEKIFVVKSYKVVTTKDKEYNSLVLEIKELLPNKRYTILYFTKMHGKEIDAIHKINHMIIKNASDNSIRASFDKLKVIRSIGEETHESQFIPHLDQQSMSAMEIHEFLVDSITNYKMIDDLWNNDNILIREFSFVLNENLKRYFKQNNNNWGDLVKFEGFVQNKSKRLFSENSDFLKRKLVQYTDESDLEFEQRKFEQIGYLYYDEEEELFKISGYQNVIKKIAKGDTILNKSTTIITKKEINLDEFRNSDSREESRRETVYLNANLNDLAFQTDSIINYETTVFFQENIDLNCVYRFDTIKIDSVVIEYIKFDYLLPQTESIDTDNLADCLDNLHRLLLDCVIDCELLLKTKNTDKIIRTDIDTLLSTIRYLKEYSDNETYLQYLNNGIIQLSYPYISADSLSYSNVKGREENLTKSIYRLDKLIDLIKLNVHSDNEICTTNELNTFVNIKKQLEKSKKALTKNVSKIVKEINSVQLLRNFDIFSTNTSNLSFKTRASYFIIPDFGLPLFMGSSLTDDFNGRFKYVTRPYFGVNLGVGPLNKDVRIRDIANKQARHYLSFNVGLTFIDLSSEDGISDLYNNMSLLLGASIRVARPIRITAGAVLHKFDGHNPVVTNSKIGAMPFISLSLDVDLLDYFGKIGGKIFK